MPSEIRLRLPADHRRVTVPVNMDQNARSRMAANAQNLYRPFPNRLASELSFFVDGGGTVVGRASSSFIEREREGWRERGEERARVPVSGKGISAMAVDHWIGEVSFC